MHFNVGFFVYLIRYWLFIRLPNYRQNRDDFSWTFPYPYILKIITLSYFYNVSRFDRLDKCVLNCIYIEWKDVCLLLCTLLSGLIMIIRALCVMECMGMLRFLYAFCLYYSFIIIILIQNVYTIKIYQIDSNFWYL